MGIPHLKMLREAPHHLAEPSRPNALRQLVAHIVSEPRHVVELALGQAQQGPHGPVIVDLDEVHAPAWG